MSGDGVECDGDCAECDTRTQSHLRLSSSSSCLLLSFSSLSLLSLSMASWTAEASQPPPRCGDDLAPGRRKRSAVHYRGPPAIVCIDDSNYFDNHIRRVLMWTDMRGRTSSRAGRYF